MQTFQKLALVVKERVKSNFAYATIHFIIIMSFITLFTSIFETSNSMVAIIFVQITLSTITRDLSASPFKNFIKQAIVLLFMSIGACISVNIPALWAIPVHLIVIFIIVYIHTYEHIRQLYFPYVLSYLFFVCLAPITFTQLPLRIISVIFGCMCLILYQWIVNHKRIIKTTRQVLLSIVEEANICIDAILNKQEVTIKIEEMRASLSELSQLIYDRRKKLLCISDASFEIIDVARGLENLVIEINKKEIYDNQDYEQILYQTTYYLACFKSFLLEESKDIPMISKQDLDTNDKEAQGVYLNLNYIRSHMLNMNRDDKKDKYERSRTTIRERIKTALHYSEVRFVYALRLSILLSLALFVVQYYKLDHGRWLLFTLVSISLPYVEEIMPKAKKRIIATLIGGTISLLCFSFIEDSSIRTIILMASGYVTFYCVDYATSFICSTIGALGGNMLATSFGVEAVSEVVLIRLVYIVVGVIIALIVCNYIYPYNKKKALIQLVDKHIYTNSILSNICHQSNLDKQYYYHLIIQSFMQEQTLRKHAYDLNYTSKIEHLISDVRDNVRNAHLCKENNS